MKPEPRRDTARTVAAVSPADGEARRRERARQAIESGKLPRRRPDRTWGGPGAGACCTICGVSVNSDEIELEIEFARDGSGFDTHHLHMRCYADWEAELRSSEQNGVPRVLPASGEKSHNDHCGDDRFRQGPAR